MTPDARRAWTIAGFAATLHLALVVFAFGFASLLTDVEVVGDPAAGRLVGPIIVGASAVVVLLVVARAITRSHTAAWGALVGAAGAWAAGAASGALAYAFATAALLPSLTFALVFMIAGFGLLIVGSAAIVCATAVAVGRVPDGGRPRWPWERDDEA